VYVTMRVVMLLSLGLACYQVVCQGGWVDLRQPARLA